MKINSPFFILAIVSIIFGACKKEDGPAGKNSLISQVAEPAGANCTTGGIKIASGIDANSNNVLDSNEIQKTDYICNATSIYNKETIINFPIVTEPQSAGTTLEMSEVNALYNFNIANYPADSVSFSALIGTNDATATAFVELYDQTNNKVIANTTLSSNTTATKTTTVNLLKDLPKGPVTLNFRLRSDKALTVAYVWSAALKIYKK